MSFVKLSIFGTSFEVHCHPSILILLTAYDTQVTTRYVDLQPVGMGQSPSLSFVSFETHLARSKRCLWARLVGRIASAVLESFLSSTLSSSAKDQLTGASVAIKKIMKPFSTPVLSKRTYRELKLLKHIQHENVCVFSSSCSTFLNSLQIISLSDVFISPLEDLCVKSQFTLQIQAELHILDTL